MQEIIKTVILEEDLQLRSHLKNLLEGYVEVQVVGEFDNLDPVLEQWQSLNPRVIFLSIDTVKPNRFALLKKLPQPFPEIILLSSHNGLATEAFESGAFDYLLKPIDKLRLEKTWQKLKSKVTRLEKTILEQPVRQRVRKVADRIYIEDNGRGWFIPLANIPMFESQGNYTQVCYGDQKPLLLSSLRETLKKLDETDFFRANRSQIVNLNYVTKVQIWFQKRLKFTLKDGTEVELSRRQSKIFRDQHRL